ncbi:hypothetical protein O181_019603 [Austropuccinia psidii MF-1]|uniref:Uncharacterized protein n=1 Tax=Austropuccinia psidii MF-1 TaxID=1389203 RepID=A0A9Q3GTR6_9BASI|nr:hypothetical protein [Austropuccinia psidii MF-1]
MVTSLLDLSEVIIQPMKNGDGKRTFELGPILTMSVTHGIQMPNELTIPPFVEPSQPNEPPIPGPSQPSELHEDASTHELEPEVAPTQSTGEPFGKSPLHFFHSFQLFLTPPLPISSSSGYTHLCDHH